MNSNNYLSPHPQAAFRVVDQAAIVVLADSGEVKILNEVGTRVWELADGSRRVQEIIETIVSEFDVSLDQAVQEVTQFVEELVHAKMLVVHDQPLIST